MLGNFDNAFEIAKKHHEGQLRKDGTLYIDHPLRVVEFLKRYNFPEEVLICAILHDICEDTDITVMQINELFGVRVGFIINALSKNTKPKNLIKLKRDFEEHGKNKRVSNLEQYNTFEEYVDYRFHLYINRLYTGIIAEPWIFFIKVSDQIDNLSDMKPFSKEKKLRKIEEIEKYFTPIYKKCKSIFVLHPKYLELYEEFLKELKKILTKAKEDI